MRTEAAPTAAWAVLGLLFLANLLNFFDRAIPAVVVEPMRHAFGLDDFRIGIVSAAFTVVYAVAGVPLGRLADAAPRRIIVGLGLVAWSVATGLSGLAWSFASLLVLRMAVGVGEASYGPAAISLLGDLFPSARRSRATGLYMLGLPAGLMLAFFTVGAVVRIFGTWRAPFYLAVVPGILLGLAFLLIREPARGGAEALPDAMPIVARSPIERPMLRVLSIPTLWWIILSGIAANFSSYAANGFLVPLLQRYYDLKLEQAAVDTGLIVGVTGLVGLTLGGWLADRVHQRSRRGRLLLGAASMAGAAAATLLALRQGRDGVAAFTALFAAGWLLQYQYYTCVYPAIQDVVEPRLRATAMAVYFACLYLLGGAFGPVVVGRLSDHYTHEAVLAAGAAAADPRLRAAGLHDALVLVPVALLATALALVMASRTFPADAARMRKASSPF